MSYLFITSFLVLAYGVVFTKDVSDAKILGSTPSVFLHVFYRNTFDIKVCGLFLLNFGVLCEAEDKLHVYCLWTLVVGLALGTLYVEKSLS